MISTSLHSWLLSISLLSPIRTGAESQTKPNSSKEPVPVSHYSLAAVFNSLDRSPRAQLFDSVVNVARIQGVSYVGSLCLIWSMALVFNNNSERRKCVIVWCQKWLGKCLVSGCEGARRRPAGGCKQRERRRPKEGGSRIIKDVEWESNIVQSVPELRYPRSRSFVPIACPVPLRANQSSSGRLKHSVRSILFLGRSIYLCFDQPSHRVLSLFTSELPVMLCIH